MIDFTKQEERVRDDVEKLEILNKLISTEQERKERDVHTITSLINDGLRVKNRIAQELGQARAFVMGGIDNLLEMQFDEIENVISKISEFKPEDRFKLLDRIEKKINDLRKIEITKAITNKTK